MANPGLSRSEMQAAVDALAKADGNSTAAARSLGIDRGTFRNRVEKGQSQGLLANIPPPKPRIRVPAPTISGPFRLSLPYGVWYVSGAGGFSGDPPIRGRAGLR